MGVSWSPKVPPSGGSLEIGNTNGVDRLLSLRPVPPSGGSLEIGNHPRPQTITSISGIVPPSGGSLEIGNKLEAMLPAETPEEFPLRGDP